MNSFNFSDAGQVLPAFESLALRNADFYYNIGTDVDQIPPIFRRYIGYYLHTEKFYSFTLKYLSLFQFYFNSFTNVFA